MSTSKNSTFNIDEIPTHLFQSHLENISDYLLFGEGIWWHHNTRTNDIIFYDGELEPSNNREGPVMRNHRISTVIQHQHSSWDQCIQKTIRIPIKTMMKMVNLLRRRNV